MLLSVIIVSYKVKGLLIECLRSLFNECQGIEHEIIVVDNNSCDGTVETITRDFTSIKMISNSENVGFAKANNQGYAISKGENLLLLNPDTVIKPGAVKKVMEFMDGTPGCGMAGCRLTNMDGSLQKSIKRFPSPLNNILTALSLDKLIHSTEWRKSYYISKPFKVDYVSGAFMMIRRKALEEETYLLSPEFHMYSEEKDLALRLKERGWNCYFVPGAEIVHYGGQSTRRIPEEMFLELQRSQVKFFYTHYKGIYAKLLDFTWWLVIFCSWLKSIPISLISDQSRRTSMKLRAVVEYPKYERPWRA